MLIVPMVSTRISSLNRVSKQSDLQAGTEQ